MLTIVQGEDRLITVRLEDENQDAINLSPFDEITASFKRADNTVMEKKLSLAEIVIPGAAPQNGKIQIILTDTDTAALKAAKIDFELILDDGTERKIIQFPGQIEVKKRLT